MRGREGGCDANSAPDHTSPEGTRFDMADPTLPACAAPTKRDDTPVCAAPGCGKPAARKKRGFCIACYGRQYRKGTTDYYVPKERLSHPAGYVTVRAKEHPLCAARGGKYEYEHRVVLYNHRGAGPFNCHWCGQEVTWATLHVDHLDENRTNNAAENLVPSCASCNIGRGNEKNAAANRANGVMLTAFGRTMCIAEWARELGIRPFALAGRLKKGWPLEQALSAKRGEYKHPRKLFRT